MAQLPDTAQTPCITAAGLTRSVPPSHAAKTNRPMAIAISQSVARTSTGGPPTVSLSSVKGRAFS